MFVFGFMFSPWVLFPVLFCSFCSVCVFPPILPVLVLFPALVIVCTSSSCVSPVPNSPCLPCVYMTSAFLFMDFLDLVFFVLFCLTICVSPAACFLVLFDLWMFYLIKGHFQLKFLSLQLGSSCFNPILTVGTDKGKHRDFTQGRQGEFGTGEPHEELVQTITGQETGPRQEV